MSRADGLHVQATSVCAALALLQLIHKARGLYCNNIMRASGSAHDLCLSKHKKVARLHHEVLHWTAEALSALAAYLTIISPCSSIRTLWPGLQAASARYCQQRQWTDTYLKLFISDEEVLVHDILQLFSLTSLQSRHLKGSPVMAEGWSLKTSALGASLLPVALAKLASYRL